MSKFFIHRPIVAMVISIVMVIVGTVALLGLPTAQFPDIIPPEILVSAVYPGADAKTLEQSVTTPLEQQISGVDNMEYMSSTSANNGAASITVTFDIKTDPNIDQVLTQLRTSQAASQLPAEVNTSGLTVQKSLNSPLMFVSIYSSDNSLDDVFLSNYAYINLVDELTRVQGVARVQAFGGGQYAMRIWIKPDQLAKLGVTVPDIITAVQSQNRVNPAGRLGGRPAPKGQEFTYTVMAQGRFSSPEEFGGIIIRSNPDGSTLRLKDIARIEMGAQNYDTISRFNGKSTSGLAIYQLPGSNAVETAKNVTARLDELKKRFPKGLALDMTLDTTKVVTQGMKEITVTLLEALLLVVLVVYLFLQGWRATLIPLLAVPVSLIGTFMIFPMLGFSVNTLSLFGLVLAIGLVVDDAIVVVEAVEHHIEKGLSPKDASLKAMEEVSGPVIAIALILSAVFIPTAFIPGITGRLYQQFAVTIAISVIISAFNALSLSPALCALLLKPKKPSRGPLARFFDWFNRVFGIATNGYINMSGAMIRKSVLSLLFLGLVTVTGVGLGSRIPSSFLPNEDQGYLLVAMRLPDAASLERTDEAARKIEQRVMKIPGVASVFSVVGFDLLTGIQNTYNGIFWVTLKDWSERKAANEQFEVIQGNLAAAISTVPDAFAFPITPPAIPGVGSSGGFTFVLEDRSGGSAEEFGKNVFKFAAEAAKRKELVGVSPAFLPTVPQLYADVDREKAARQGVAISDVYNTLQTFMGGYLVNYFNRFGRQWQVYLAAEGEYRVKPEDIGQFYVQNSAKTMVPLSTLTRIEKRNGPEFNYRYNEYRATQIFGAAAPGFSSGQAMAALEEVFAQTMPSQMAFDYTGMSYQEKKAADGIPPSAIYAMSILFVFLILAAQYESWSLPFSVLLVTPVAVLGAYFALWMRGFENNVYAQIGLVMLIGMSAKNAILIVEFAKLEYEKGRPIAEAALTAARLRLRPILMTAFAFILGCVPLWTASGSGAISRRILGTVVIGGMLAATIIAIFLIPVTFVVVERFSALFSRKKSLAALESEGEPA
ncbi:efflux RND transporter permease subunit [Bryobacter aggregatus]|uniref:efflux RND transporter permease subunit n=1 Tax=Bryobacter aggregatus TaxID=360054 RepID=UPI0004E102D0|nr:multidrug efflux RND transporter permease subunit [Bryobacter aggregatus]